MSGATDEVRLARAYLSRVAESASFPLWLFVSQLGPVDAAAAIRRGDVPDEVAAITQARRALADPHSDLEVAARHRVRLVTPEDDDWPHVAFGALERTAATLGRSNGHRDGGDLVPPPALWVRGSGDLRTLGVRAVSIVGARAATAYGQHATTDIAFGLARRNVVVISGGAYGIDAVAHRAALAADGQTVIVTAGGAERPYPAGNDTLYDRVAEHGLVLSENPPGSAPHRHRFLSRNRLIAALGTGTVVVEAALRSGARNTANHCFALGRPLMAVPGPVTSIMSAGCHALLRRVPEPALLVTSADDVLAVVGGIGEVDVLSERHDADGGDVRRALDALTPLQRRVYDGLSARQFATPTAIAARAGVGELDVIRSVPALDLAGLLDVSDAGYRVRGRSP